MDFVEFIIDQLLGIPNIHYKRMFGGFGLYKGEVFFGIIFHDVLYFKTDEKSRVRYIQEGSTPFAPNAKQVLKNYLEVPVNVLEDREALAEWAEEAIEVAENNF